MAGSRDIAPSQPEIVRAISSTRSIPQVIGASASASAPKGMSRKTAMPQGVTQNAVIGTAAKLVSRL